MYVRQPIELRVLLLGRVALGVQRPIVVKLSRLSVCPVHCGKTADPIRMPLGVIGRTGPGMRQVVGFGDRSTGRGTVGANLPRHCNQWRVYVVCVRQCLNRRVVRAVGRGVPVLDGGPPRAMGEGGFGGFCSPFLQWEMPLRRRR